MSTNNDKEKICPNGFHSNGHPDCTCGEKVANNDKKCDHRISVNGIVIDNCSCGYCGPDIKGGTGSSGNDKKGWDWRKEFEKYFNRRHSQMTHLNDRQGKKDCEVCKEDREKNPKGYYLTYLSEKKFYWNRGMYEDVVAFISKLVEEVKSSAYERGREGELSKLIEECGDKFMELRSPMSNSKDYVDSRADGFLWTAISEENVGDDGIRRSCIGNGSTPEEAVRNLLSTLNDMK